MPVIEYIVSASNLKDIFIADTVLIAGIPALVFKLRVDNNAGKRFIRYSAPLLLGISI